MSNAPYVPDETGLKIRSTRTGEVVLTARSEYLLPDYLREPTDPPDKLYEQPEELVRRLIKRAVLAGDMSGGGFHHLPEMAIIVDGVCNVIIAATPVYFSTKRMVGGEEVTPRTTDPHEVVVDLIVADACSKWIGNRWNNHGYERKLIDAVLRVEHTKDGWIAMRDGAILSGQDNAPAYFACCDEAITAADDTHSAPGTAALRFSNLSSLKIIRR